jgi:hypothetical protein
MDPVTMAWYVLWLWDEDSHQIWRKAVNMNKQLQTADKEVVLQPGSWVRH